MGVWELGPGLVRVPGDAWVSTSGATPSPVSGAEPGGSSTLINTFIGPAVVAAIVTALLGSLIQYLFARKADSNTALRDLRLRSLNEFYAPVRRLLEGNNVLHGQLRAECGDDGTGEWHLLSNLAKIQQLPVARSIVDDILAINEKIGVILDTRSGLALGNVPSMAEWEVHRRVLARAVKEGAQTVKVDLTYFPTAFEREIVAEHDKLVADVKSSVGMK